MALIGTKAWACTAKVSKAMFRLLTVQKHCD
jgi:hypothetical protein